MTREEIEKMVNVNVEGFKATITKGPFVELLKKSEVDFGDDKLYQEALYQGYLDACRTFKWVKKCEGQNRVEEINKIFKENVVQDIKKFLTEKGAILEHDAMCKKIIKAFGKSNVTNMTYGKAQKIINMAFKYLYCCRHDEQMDEQFKQCHMPLDSFSLEWFKQRFKEYDFTGLEEKNKYLFKKEKEELRLKFGSIGSWSAMESEDDEEYSYEYYPYEFYSQQIKAYCDQEDINITPLELDFVVWPKMQKIMAADAFLKAYSDDSKERDEESKKYDIGNLESTCKERIGKIRGIVNN